MNIHCEVRGQKISVNETYERIKSTRKNHRRGEERKLDPKFINARP